MSRRVLGWNRVVTFVVALVLLALGVAVALWGAGQLVRLWPAAPDRLSTKPVTDVYAASWWRPVMIAAGAVLTLLGLWWLLAHIPRTRVGALRLPGSGRAGGPSGGTAGQLVLDADSAVDAAAEELERVRGVRAASGRLKQSRGQVLAEMSLTAGPHTDLARLSSDIDAVSADLHQVLSRDDVRGRVRVRIARRDEHRARVQ